jgi:integrase
VDWARDRFCVHAPKTEHHKDGGERWVPIFPELRPHLEEAYHLARDGALYVVNRYRDTNQNLRTQLARIIRRAGRTPWPKLFHNLRASRQTELVERYPIHVVCAWLGNTAAVAAEHYLQVTEAHYEQAAQIPAQSGAERACQQETAVPAEQPNVRRGKEMQLRSIGVSTTDYPQGE